MTTATTTETPTTATPTTATTTTSALDDEAWECNAEPFGRASRASTSDVGTDFVILLPLSTTMPARVTAVT